MELIVSVSNTETLRAAVQSGADAIIVRPPDLAPRRAGLPAAVEEFRACAEYCRVRGVNIYAAVDAIVCDDEFGENASLAVEYARVGANAIVAADTGLVRAIRKLLPETPLLADAKLCVRNLDGAKFAAISGFSRVMLPPELPREEVAFIAKYAGVETGVQVHGTLCAAYAGQCAFSAVAERKSANRGQCAMLCRKPYGGDAKGDDYPLSLKDLCLADHVTELYRMGVKSLCVEARGRAPEYAAYVSGVYAGAIHKRRQPNTAQSANLESVFANGTTDGYYARNIGDNMFGARGTEPHRDSEFMRTIRRDYQNSEYQRVPVRFAAAVKSGVPARIIVQDDRRNLAAASSGVPEQAYFRELTTATLTTLLHQTGGTPFYTRNVRCVVDAGLRLPVEYVNEMRKNVLAQLLEKRKPFAPPSEGEFEPGYTHLGREEPPVFTVSVRNANQLSGSILELRPAMVYVPAEELSKTECIRPFVEAGVPVGVILPRVLPAGDKKRVEAILRAAKKAGMNDALCTDYSHIAIARKLGLNPRGDFSLNICNSQSMRAARDAGLKSAAASFELSLPQLRALSKPLDTEVFAYGRLPLMLTENCIIKRVTGICSCDSFRGLEDKRGLIYPVVRESGCRSVVLNAQKLFMADRLVELRGIGLWALRLSFTTENARECADVCRSYIAGSGYSPGSVTRGLLYRGSYDD